MTRRTLSIRDLLLFTTGALALLIMVLAGQQVYLQWQRLEHIEPLQKSSFLREQMFDAIEALSTERELGFYVLNAPNAVAARRFRQSIEENRRRVDQTLQNIQMTLRQQDYSWFNAQWHRGERAFVSLHSWRTDIDAAMQHPSVQYNREHADRWFSQSTVMVEQMFNLWMEFTKHFSGIDPIVTQRIMYKHYLGIILRYSGRERALIGGIIIANTEVTFKDQALLLQWRGVVEQGWKFSHAIADRAQLLPAITPYINDAESQYLTLHDMVKNIFYVPGARRGASYPISAGFWFELAGQITDSLYALKDAALKETHNYIDQLEQDARKAIILDVLIFALALILCVYSFWIIIFRVIHPVNAMVQALLDTSAGKTVPLQPVTVARRDEISKLAQVLYAFQQNMDELRRASAERERYTYALERSNKELDDFAYIASHDMKEPLRGIHNHSRFLLEDNEDKLAKESVKSLWRLVYLSQRMERLVNDLLYFSRLGRQDLAIQPTDINEVLHDIECTLETFLEERGGRITAPKSLPIITCDKPRVTELFRNLITNAIKYNDHAEKIIEVGFLETHNNIDNNMRRNVFYVKDNGRGIPREFHDEIFRIFKRLQAADEKEEGTGAGLTFVKKIVERHGGRIWLESVPGEGTTFYFTLEGQNKESDIPA